MFYAFLAPLGYGIGNSLSKITGNAVGYIRGAILLSFFTSIFLFLINLYFGFNFENTIWIFITLLFGIYGYLPLVFFIKAVSTGKIGVVVPIVDMSIIFPILLASIFLNQYLSLYGLLFIFVILLGVIIMSVNFSDFKNSNILNKDSGVLFAIAASLMWGLGYFLWSFSSAQIGPIQTSLMIEIGVLLAALFHLMIINKEKIFTKIENKIIFVGIVIGLCMTLGDLGTNIGMQKIGVPLTMAITGARPAVGAIVGYILFKEKIELKQVVAIICIGLGVVGVSLFR